MLEIPESRTLATQANETLPGKKVSHVANATSKHKFAWFNGDPAGYATLLTGRTIESAKGHGMFTDLYFDQKTSLAISDGTLMRYVPSQAPVPDKYQLLIGFDDGSCLVFSVAMYGGIWAWKGTFDNPYYVGSLNSLSPLGDAFDEKYFNRIFDSVTKDLSMKALLATEQRIPGLGNGVLQDILFNAGIHPKMKRSAVSDFKKGELFHSLKVTLKKMTDLGGRDTEKDLFGNPGGYKTILSKNTLKDPCPNCGDTLVKQPYMGGAIYFCPTCQPAG